MDSSLQEKKKYNGKCVECGTTENLLIVNIFLDNKLSNNVDHLELRCNKCRLRKNLYT